MIVDNDLQIGKHFTKEMENDEHHPLEWWGMEPEQDFPISIHIFDDQHQWIETTSCVIVRYASGLILKCSFETPYNTCNQSNNENCIKKIVFHNAESRYDIVMNYIPHYVDVFFFPPYIGDSSDYPSHCPMVYHVRKHFFVLKLF